MKWPRSFRTKMIVGTAIVFVGATGGLAFAEWSTGFVSDLLKSESADLASPPSPMTNGDGTLECLPNENVVVFAGHAYAEGKGPRTPEAALNNLLSAMYPKLPIEIFKIASRTSEEVVFEGVFDGKRGVMVSVRHLKDFWYINSFGGCASLLRGAR